MSTEEPAWRAELREELRIALGASNIENIYVRRRAHDAVFPSVVAMVQAAEERGRETALREAAEKIRTYVETRENVDLMRLFWRGAANHIDPDTP